MWVGFDTLSCKYSIAGMDMCPCQGVPDRSRDTSLCKVYKRSWGEEVHQPS